MRLNMLLGTLIGFTVAFFIFGFWKDNLDWSLWIALLAGGAIGHFIIAIISKHEKNK